MGSAQTTLLVLRRNPRELKRPFRMAGASIIASLAFFCSNLVIYWTGFRTNSFLFSLVASGFVAYAVYYHLIARKPARQFVLLFDTRCDRR